MVDALPQVDADLQAELVRIILQREQPAGLTALPERFDRLADAARRQIIANAGRLSPSLRVGIRSSNSQTRLNTLQIIRGNGNLRLAYLAALGMHDGAVRIRAEAAGTLHDMARRHLKERTTTAAALAEAAQIDGRIHRSAAATIRIVAEERVFLIAALRDALHSFESHHRSEVIETAMLMADVLEDSLFQSNTLARGKLTHAMIEILGASLDPRFAVFVYIALKRPELRRRIISMLASEHNPEFFVEMIRLDWMARVPAIRRHLHMIKSLEWLGDGFEPAFLLPPDAAAKTPGWVAALGLAVEQKVAILVNFLLLDNHTANRTAAWQLASIDSPTATAALESNLNHEDDVVRRIAERALAGRRRRQRERSDQAGTPSAPWMQMLDEAGLTPQCDDLWQHFDRLAPQHARIVGQRILELEPGIGVMLQTKVIDAHPSERLRALRFLRAFELLPRFSRDVFNLANDPVVEVRTSAVQSLGAIGDATSRRILERAMSDGAPAVEAAAIEGLEQIGALKSPGPLLQKIEHADSAVRAAAIRGLLRMREPRGAVALVNMLHDERAEHRCTALWMIDQLKLSMLAGRLDDMAQSDPDRRIARTARQVARRLRRQTRETAGAAAAQEATT